MLFTFLVISPFSPAWLISKFGVRKFWIKCLCSIFVVLFFFILLMYFKIGTGVKNEINRSKHNAKAQNWVNSR